MIEDRVRWTGQSSRARAIGEWCDRGVLIFEEPHAVAISACVLRARRVSPAIVGLTPLVSSGVQRLEWPVRPVELAELDLGDLP